MSDAVRWSVVIPCYNAENTLAMQLDAVLAQDFDEAFELLVVDNGSTDTSAQIVSAYARRDSRVRLVDAGEVPGVSYARNAGVRGSEGEYVFLCDADDVVQPGWLRAMAAKCLAGAECVGGDLVRQLPDGTRLGTDSAVRRQNWHIPWAMGANCGFSRRAFDAVGGFNESYRAGGDDAEFFLRAHLAGFETHHAEGALVAYSEPQRLWDLARRHFWYGNGEVALYRDFAALGMPRSSLLALPVAVVGGVLLTLVPRARRRGMSLVARRLGRVAGSLRARTLYV